MHITQSMCIPRTDKGCVCATEYVFVHIALKEVSNRRSHGNVLIE